MPLLRQGCAAAEETNGDEVMTPERIDEMKQICDEEQRRRDDVFRLVEETVIALPKSQEGSAEGLRPFLKISLSFGAWTTFLSKRPLKLSLLS
jgi:hypothetical protein